MMVRCRFRAEDLFPEGYVLPLRLDLIRTSFGEELEDLESLAKLIALRMNTSASDVFDVGSLNMKEGGVLLASLKGELRLSRPAPPSSRSIIPTT